MASSYNPPWEVNRKDGEETPILQNHHIIPSSRGGRRVRNLIQGFPADLHWAWHRLFGNLLPQEIIVVLLYFLFRPGQFSHWKKFIPDGAEPPETFTPDQIIMELMKVVFPKNWVPGDELMARLEEKRAKVKPKRGN